MRWFAILALRVEHLLRRLVVLGLDSARRCPRGEHNGLAGIRKREIGPLVDYDLRRLRAVDAAVRGASAVRIDIETLPQVRGQCGIVRRSLSPLALYCLRLAEVVTLVLVGGCHDERVIH